MPTREQRPGSKRGPDPRYYDLAHLRPQLGKNQASWLKAQQRRTTAEQKRERHRLYMRRRRADGIDTDTRRKRDRENAARWSAAGLCTRCGRQSITGRRRCEKCADHHRRRAQAIARGVCIRCALNNPLPGRRICRICRGRYEVRRLTRKIGRKRARQYQTDQKRAQRRKAAGQCPRCTGPLAVNRMKCADCLSDQRAANRKRKTTWAASGRCLKCGKPREDARLHCGHCREQGYAYKLRYRADGLCQCGRFVVKGRASCAACLTTCRDGQRRRRAAAKRKESL